MKNKLIGKGIFLTVSVFFGLVFIGCQDGMTADDNPSVSDNPPADTVDPAFWFIEIYDKLIERIGEISSDGYTGGVCMGQMATYQYVCNAINKKWGTDYTLSSQGVGSVLANCEYLLKMIDKANKNRTSYGTSTKATKQLIDKTAVDAAVSTLWLSNGKFVAVAEGNTAAYSTDGINWTAATLPSVTTWYNLTYGNGRFVAISSGAAAYSTNGIDWVGIIVPDLYWQNLTYGNGKFVAIIANGSNEAIYSTNGVSWTGTTLPSSSGWREVTYGNGKFVAIARGKVAYSTDGINWTGITTPSNSFWSDITYGNGKFVIIGSGKAAYSADGINWTETTLPSSSSWADATYGNGKFVAIGNGKVVYSADGINWTEITTPSTTLPSGSSWAAVTYGNGKFVAITGYNNNKAACSTDGINWTAATLPRVTTWRSVTYGEL
jgi:hypothetical protein